MQVFATEPWFLLVLNLGWNSLTIGCLDVQHPLQWDRLRDKTLSLVACLVPECSVDDQLAQLDVLRDGDLAQHVDLTGVYRNGLVDGFEIECF